jgi:glucokinase
VEITVAVPGAAGDGTDGGRSGHVLALDIGGTKIASGVVDGAGAVRSFVVAPTDTTGDAQESLAALFELGRRAVAASGIDWSGIGTVSIACGGPLDVGRGLLVAPPHLPGWHDVPIVALAEEALGRPAVLENDAAAAAAGEHRYGAGVGTRNMVYLTVSTGVGGGVIVDGRLYSGALGNGGELGHVTVDWDGRVCRGCGRRGCLEAYASGTSIAERAQEAGLPFATAKEVAEAARAGDPGAAALWDETVAALACGVTSIVNVFEPELVVIGGGVSRVGEQLLAPLREQVHAQAMSPGGRAVRVVAAALGDRVGVVGAAAVVRDRLEPEALAANA